LAEWTLPVAEVRSSPIPSPLHLPKILLQSVQDRVTYRPCALYLIWCAAAGQQRVKLFTFFCFPIRFSHTRAPRGTTAITLHSAANGLPIIGT
jgi:hypothetical protein